MHYDFLLESIRKAVDGDNVFSPEMTSRLVQSLISDGINYPPALITTSLSDDRVHPAHGIHGQNQKENH